jgi:hypothetical protein
MQFKTKGTFILFIPWFSSPPRLTYVHVVEKAKMVLESLSTHSSSQTHHQGDDLEVSTKILGNTNFSWLTTKHKSSLGDA